MYRLAKWYLDCVSEAGDVAILYWASLRWGVVRIGYGAALLRPRPEAAVDRFTLRPGAPPAMSADGSLRWECPALDVRGRWAIASAGPERTLLEQAEGRVHWRCVSLGGDAAVHVGGQAVEGLGYAEHLTMTIKPWDLPFNELRWGRFVSPAVALVWMQWEGGMRKTWAFGGGFEPVRARVLPDTVELPDAGMQLAIEAGDVIRTGAVSHTALRPLRLLTWMLPRWRTAHETKWLARGTLTGGAAPRAGWVLHELVRWP